MKRKLTISLVSLLLVVGMLFTLCACSSYNSILKAYKNENYTEIEATDEQKDAAKKMFGDDYDSKLTLHALKKEKQEGEGILGSITSAVSYVVIAEFKSTDELNEKMRAHVSEEDADKIADAIQNLDTVNGNCVLVLTTVPEGATIFKNAKK